MGPCVRLAARNAGHRAPPSIFRYRRDLSILRGTERFQGVRRSAAEGLPELGCVDLGQTNLDWPVPSKDGERIAIVDRNDLCKVASEYKRRPRRE